MTEMATKVQSPTSMWLATSDDLLPPLTGPAATAERLLLLLHYGIDWDSWMGDHVKRYWEHILPDRVLIATYREPTLARWWRAVASSVESRPRTKAQRVEIAQLLGEDSRPVLEVLRYETEALLLRVRITADEVREARKDSAA